MKRLTKNWFSQKRYLHAINVIKCICQKVKKSLNNQPNCLISISYQINPKIQTETKGQNEYLVKSQVSETGWISSVIKFDYGFYWKLSGEEVNETPVGGEVFIV